ncbi:MAG: ABC transporter ATP-binding protein [Deltaproteobacteria bacterium]|nr:ABC transporter ATP-binding protein [Deltaproteobacteria bacterium]
MTAPLLELADVHVHYGAIHALRGLSLTVGEGEVVTLLGSNGAGKSTTLRAVSALVRPSRGRITFLGRDVAGLPADRLVALGMAHAPEGRGIFQNLTVHENLELGAFLRTDKDAIEADIERAFALFPRLKERVKQSAGTLSGGEQQMLSVARALMCRPKLLLLDEPSLGLAPQVVELIFRIVREINAGGTAILLVEQNAHLALKVAHRGYVLETGALVLQGPAAELLANDEIRRAYLGE